MRSHHLPTAEQAQVIRDVLGIRKRVELTPQALERLRARTASWNLLQPANRQAFGLGRQDLRPPHPYPPRRRRAKFREKSCHGKKNGPRLSFLGGKGGRLGPELAGRENHRLG